MISIQAIRMAIGYFLGKARFLTSISKNQKAFNIARRKVEGRTLVMNQGVLNLL